MLCHKQLCWAAAQNICRCRNLKGTLTCLHKHEGIRSASSWCVRRKTTTSGCRVHAVYSQFKIERCILHMRTSPSHRTNAALKPSAHPLLVFCAGLIRGMVNQKVLPSPTLDIAPSTPPSTETCLEQMLNPRPVPPLVLGLFMSSSVPCTHAAQLSKEEHGTDGKTGCCLADMRCSAVHTVLGFRV